MKGAALLLQTIMTLLVAVAFTLPAVAQNDFDTMAEEWRPEVVYNGWHAEDFLDNAEVYGPGGEEIGSIENLLIDKTGQIVALVAEVGGFWDIGDTHVAIPWDEVKFNGYKVQVPVTEDNADDYSIFKEGYFTSFDIGNIETVDDDLVAGYDIWKATDLIDDYAVLETGAGFGYVDDLIFDNGGMLQSVIVSATDYLDPGSYGYPWYGYGYDGYAWDPGLRHYIVPYDESEIQEFATVFDYEDYDRLM